MDVETEPGEVDGQVAVSLEGKHINAILSVVSALMPNGDDGEAGLVLLTVALCAAAHQHGVSMDAVVSNVAKISQQPEIKVLLGLAPHADELVQ